MSPQPEPVTPEQPEPDEEPSHPPTTPDDED